MNTRALAADLTASAQALVDANKVDTIAEGIVQLVETERFRGEPGIREASQLAIDLLPMPPISVYQQSRARQTLREVGRSLR